MGTSELQRTNSIAANNRRAAENALVRDAKILRLYSAGMNVQQISKACKVSYDEVRAATRRALREYMEPTTQEIIARQHYILTEMRRAVWTDALRGEPGAWDRLLKTLEHEAKLTGIFSITALGMHSGEDFGTTTAKMLLELARLTGMPAEQMHEIIDLESEQT